MVLIGGGPGAPEPGDESTTSPPARQAPTPAEAVAGDPPTPPAAPAPPAPAAPPTVEAPTPAATTPPAAGGEPPPGGEPAGDGPLGDVPTKRFSDRLRLPGGPLLPLGGIIVIGLIVAGFVITSSPSKANPAKTTTTTTTPTTAAPPGKTVSNAADGFSITVPAGWHQVATTSVPLLAQKDNTTDAFKVQVYQLTKAVDTSNVKDVKALTDTFLQSANIEVVQQRAIVLNGLKGYYYLLRYKSGSQTGANSLEFLFQGRKMSILTFQALPQTDFTKALGTVFDTIANSYTSNPNVLGPPPPAISAAPPTTATGKGKTKATSKATSKTTAKTTATTAKPKKG
ncbi:MAG: hypothetical protein ACRDX8_04880 [Acidimicrobiales bacterium]